jgi:UDP-N-acetylmuramate dehydrogenase
MNRDAGFTLQEHIPLAPFTTLKIGGPARYFVRAESEEQVVRGFEYARENALEVFVLGGGSNVLISDEGFQGLVLQIALRGVSRAVQNDGVLVTAPAGEDWDAFVASCVADGLAGIECLSGIPGFVGGTPVQNVGAYGQEVSETIVSVRCYDRESGEIVELTNAECGFSYRTSAFNSTERERYIVLAVTYCLGSGCEPKIVYKDLKEYFGEIGREKKTRRRREIEQEELTTEQHGKDQQEKNRENQHSEAHNPTLQETRDAVLNIRRAKSMVIDPGDPNSRSAGSFFKNPVVTTEKYSEIVSSIGIEVPKFAVDESRVKIPAAWLIENAGFYKGYSLGNAGISTKHTLALINLGGATAMEIIELKDRIQAAVAEKFSISLIPEPVFVGSF